MYEPVLDAKLVWYISFTDFRLPLYAKNLLVLLKEARCLELLCGV